jgi:hypothetical protein
MFGRNNLFLRDKKGKLTTQGLPKSWNNVYAQSTVKYLNYLEPLFNKAQNKSNFQFILTLLRFRGIQSSGENPYENSIETIDTLMSVEKRIKGRARLNVFLWVYGHIIESSEPYEVIANLLNICLGKSYRLFNYPFIKTKYGYRPQYPFEKIACLENLAEQAKMPDVLEPIKEILDRDLRNAVFHSDYSVSDGEVIINKPQKIYTRNETLTLLNKALAYHETIKNLISAYTKSYNKPGIIKVSSDFSSDPEDRAQVIVRKNHGVMALKAALTKEQIKKGKIQWSVGHYLPYEQRLIDKGQYLLPRSRVELWNSILNKLPNFVNKRVVSLVEKYIINK